MSKNYQRSFSGMVQNRAREVSKVPIINSGLTRILTLVAVICLAALGNEYNTPNAHLDNLG